MKNQSITNPDQFGIPSLKLERWKDVAGYEGSYLVSDFGRVFSIPKTVDRGRGGIYTTKPRILRNVHDTGGFMVISLFKKRFSIHSLVASHFVDNHVNGINVRHIDKDKTNNHYLNLEWFNNVTVSSKESEVWADFPDFEGVYQVSNLGRVLRIYKSQRRIRKAYFQKKEGYYAIDLHLNNVRYKFLIHRMVATCFVKNKNPEINIQVNHKNGIKTDNHYLNLEWVTKSENAIHAVKMGLTKKLRVRPGEINNMSKLKREQVVKIREMHKEGNSFEAIARSYNVTAANISMICKRKTWKHIE